MCGIIGIVSRARPERDVVVQMRDSLRHRGPDNDGLWQSEDGSVTLGHRRLAIIDLLPRGRQPMSDGSGKLWITFNGEIYNYRELRRELEARGHQFRTATDTEVILEAYSAWGRDCLTRLNGMFAFGLYDSTKRVVLMARDRAGEKPLFYCHKAGRLALVSELKALMADPMFQRQLDPEGLDYFLASVYVPGVNCILKGVRKLPPAHAASYDIEKDHLEIWPYWQVPEPVSDLESRSDEFVEELESCCRML